MIMYNDKPVTLLAPAGSFESLQAAIQAGAGAVYFGVEQLNMRAKSIQSFTLGDLEEISSICRTAGVKTYITLNTVMYDHDMRLLTNILSAAKHNGIDAVIASDFAVIEQCQQMQMPLHISTQANVSNLESVRFFSRFADVIVLARELTLKQVEEITRGIRRHQIKGPSGELVKIEVFVHGALCMAVSGKCYLSLHEQNASANRGACTQVCRRPYEVKDLETGQELLIDHEYIMSPKDLCTIDLLDRILAAGVDVLKVEGRGKSADYVHTVTSCYREAVEAIADNAYTETRIMEWKERLSTVYNRSFWEGYYLGRKLGEWTPQPGSAATEKKMYIARNTKYYPNIRVAEFLVESGSIEKGDMVLVTGPRFGIRKFRLDELRVNGAVAAKAQQGDRITFPFDVKPSTGDKLFRIVAGKPLTS